MAAMAGRSTRSLDSIRMSEVQTTGNPNEAPKAPLHEARRETGLLECPYCEHAFPLTWKRYWLSIGKMRCPKCQRKARFRTGKLYWLLYLPSLMFASMFSVYLCFVALVFLAPESLRGPYGLAAVLAMSGVAAS